MADSPEPRYPTDQQRRLLWIAVSALALTTLLAVSALIFFGFISFLSWSYPILLPIGLAVIVALVLEPVVDLVQKQGVNRGHATLVVCALSLILLILFWSFILPPLAHQVAGFFKTLPDNFTKGAALLQASLATDPIKDDPGIFTPTKPADLPSGHMTLATNTSATTPTLDLFPHSPTDVKPVGDVSKIQAWLTGNLPAIQQQVEKNIATMLYSALGPVGQAFGFILGFGFVPIYVYYFLADQETIAGHWHDYVPLRRSALRDEVISVLNEINTSLVSYFRGQIIVAGCNGVLTWLGLWAIGLGSSNSLVLGIIAGALSIVPFLGIIASIIPSLLLGYLSANGEQPLEWLRPLMVLGVFTMVQMSESMFITPRVQSHSTGLHPLAIILGILFWSLLLPGLLGPIVAVPLTCAVVVLMRRYIWEPAKNAEAVKETNASETPAASA